jgi:hypothetical protein
MFTDLPNYSYANVLHATELNSNYYFLSIRSYYVNSVLTDGTIIHKTDLNGNILDSLEFSGPQTPYGLFPKRDGNFLCLYTLISLKKDASFRSTEFKLGRIRYDSDFNFIDSFSVQIPQSAFRAGTTWYTERFGDKIIFVNEGKDTSLMNTTNYTSERIFVIDTLGNYVFDKSLFQIPHSYTDITTVDNGKNFIMRFGDIDTLTSYQGGLFRMLDANFNFTKSAVEPQNYIPGMYGMDRYDSDKFSTGFIKGSTISGSPDSFCVDIRDTNFNQIKQQCIPYDSLMVSLFPNTLNTFDTRWFDGQYPNNIYIGNNWGANFNLIPNSYFTISNLDSNLNVRWSRLFGGDYPYRIERYYSTSDGGCFLVGIRRLGNNQSDLLEPVVFKISQQGLMTNITSFAKSAQSYFSIYPNPNMGIVHIKNTSGKNYELLILNQEGKVIKRTLGIKEESHRIDLSQQASGIYFYKIFTSDGRSASGKIAIQ